MNYYNDMLVTDIERIKRAKEMVGLQGIDRQKKKEAVECLNLYRNVANEFLETGSKEEKERATEIMKELGGRWS